MSDEKREAKLDRLEVLMNYGWIGVDVGWMLEWNLFSLVCILPTLYYGIRMFFCTKRNLDAFCVTTAMTAWACMTCAWFAHDVDWWPAGKVVATCCAALCVLTIAIVEVRVRLSKETAVAEVGRFRRLRLRRP